MISLATTTAHLLARSSATMAGMDLTVTKLDADKDVIQNTVTATSRTPVTVDTVGPVRVATSALHILVVNTATAYRHGNVHVSETGVASFATRT